MASTVVIASGCYQHPMGNMLSWSSLFLIGYLFYAPSVSYINLPFRIWPSTPTTAPPSPPHTASPFYQLGATVKCTGIVLATATNSQLSQKRQDQGDSRSNDSQPTSTKMCRRDLAERSVNSCFDLLFVSVPFSPLQTTATLAATMQQRGHTVNFISFDSARSKIENLGLKLTSVGAGIPEDDVDRLFRECNELPWWKFIGKMFRFMGGLLKDIDSGLRSYLQDDKFGRIPPDLVVVAGFTNSTLMSELSLSYVTVVPSVAVAPYFVAMPYIPVFPGPPHHQSIKQRLSTFMADLLFCYLFPIIAYFVPNTKFLDLALQRKGLTLIASFPGFDFPSHVPPLTRYVGPIVNQLRSSSSTIESDVLQWIESPPGASSSTTIPVVYLSMGTVVHLTAEMQTLFLEALRPFPSVSKPRWRVLWSLPKPQWKGLPSAINPNTAPASVEDKALRDIFKVVSWTSTPAVLAHPLVKVFVSHCGGNGVHESLFAQTPIVGLPFLGDQPLNCQRVHHAKVGIALPRYVGHPGKKKPIEKDEGFWTTILVMFGTWVGRLLKGSAEITPQMVREAVEEVVFGQPQLYENRLRELHAIQRLYGGVETAADWVETAAYLKESMTEWLQTAVDKDGVVKAFSIDIGLCLFLCTILWSMFVLWICWKLITFLFRRCCRRKPEQAVVSVPAIRGRSGQRAGSGRERGERDNTTIVGTSRIASRTRGSKRRQPSIDGSNSSTMVSATTAAGSSRLRRRL
eukprot:GHVS01107030.1.p1 GENE.GHVS01107030.1~~GHVS01107030.1.p1  ORF type:complete len:742 (+),score=92.86 GHVS01107030.1:96-2321(+)